MRSSLTALFVVTTMLVAVSPTSAQVSTSHAKQAPVYGIGDLNLSVSRVYTHVFKKTSFGHEHGIEGRILSGHINVASQSGDVVFDMRSFQADTPAARKYVGLEGETDAATQQKVQANMVGADILNVADYPTARFVIKSIVPVKAHSSRGLPQIQLTGNFELHGTTRAINVVAEVNERKGWTNLRGSFRIKQTDYGITPFSKAFGVIGIADELVIYGDLWVGGTYSQLAQRPSATR